MNMHEKLLFEKIERVPVDVIKKSVSEATGIAIDVMDVKTRKREIVNARQISMALVKEYTRLSLASIGRVHGGKDHATVLHACKTISGLLDVNDRDITHLWKESKKKIREWHQNNLDKSEEEMIKNIINTEKKW